MVNLDKKQPKRYRRATARKAGPSQRKVGNLSGQGKFDKTDTAKLIADIARGIPVTIAAAAVGINPKTFYAWLDDHPDFAQALAEEKQNVIREWLNLVLSSSKEKEWRGAAWALERVYKDHFAPPAPGIALGVQQNFTITIEKAKEIQDMRAKLLPEVHQMLGLSNGQNHESGSRAS